jgi:hypothetical protein
MSRGPLARRLVAGGARSGLPALLLTLLVPSCGAPAETPSALPPAQLVDAGPAPPLAEVATTIAAAFCRSATIANEAFLRDCTARLSVAVARWADPSVAWVSAASLARCQHERDPVRALRCARLRPRPCPGRALRRRRRVRERMVLEPGHRLWRVRRAGWARGLVRHDGAQEVHRAAPVHAERARLARGALSARAEPLVCGHLGLSRWPRVRRWSLRRGARLRRAVRTGRAVLARVGGGVREGPRRRAL